MNRKEWCTEVKLSHIWKNVTFWPWAQTADQTQWSPSQRVSDRASENSYWSAVVIPLPFLHKPIPDEGFAKRGQVIKPCPIQFQSWTRVQIEKLRPSEVKWDDEGHRILLDRVRVRTQSHNMVETLKFFKRHLNFRDTFPFLPELLRKWVGSVCSLPQVC